MKHILCGIALLGLIATAGAQDKIVVKKTAGQKYSIDWSAYAAAPDAAAQAFWQVLRNDLLRSGWFISGPAASSELALTGSASGGDGVRAECRVTGKATQRTYLANAYKAQAGAQRQLAHRAADEIIEAVTGQKGWMSGRLALVSNRTGSKELYLCDTDGQGLLQLTRDGKPAIAPNWSPDGRRLVYTSFLKGFPDLYLIELTSGSRSRIANYAGVNTGGAFSPDGGSLAMVLSKDGNPDLYVRGVSGGTPARLTSTPKASEASPDWSPDGQRIVYVSDQAGSPQLYVVGRGGGAPKRLTSRGSQNVAPDWGDNGLIVYSSLVGGHYQICVVNPDTLEMRPVTSDGYDYEDPCWAPDGRHVACGRAAAYKSKVVLLDTAPIPDPPLTLTDQPGDWYSPAWMPKK